MTVGYSDGSCRFDGKISLSDPDKLADGMIGCYGRISIFHFFGSKNYKNEQSKGGVITGDMLTAVLYGGAKFDKEKIGVQAGLRASLFVGRYSRTFETNKWNVEVGMNLHVVSGGGEFIFNYSPKEGNFDFKTGASTLFGIDIIFRLKRKMIE